jgi:hypothetical protein
MVGILVHGDNHFIVRGRLPSRTEALALVRQWSIIQIGATTPPELEGWRISTREFREDLTWAVVVPAQTEMSEAVTTLLGELKARGVTIHAPGRAVTNIRNFLSRRGVSSPACEPVSGQAYAFLRSAKAQAGLEAGSQAILPTPRDDTFTCKFRFWRASARLQPALLEIPRE